MPDSSPVMLAGLRVSLARDTDAVVIIEGPSAWMIHGGYVAPEDLVPSSGPGGTTAIQEPDTVRGHNPNLRLSAPPDGDGSAWQLTEPEMRQVLALAGFLEGELAEQALRVAWGESRWSPEARGDHGEARGLYQIHASPWARFCGIAPEELDEPIANARCALRILEYEEATGGPRWRNWTTRP